jgi:hypothetical protein
LKSALVLPDGHELSLQLGEADLLIYSVKHDCALRI